MTGYNTRNSITTNYTTRPELNKNFITWNQTTDTWDSVIYTWNDYYSLVVGTEYTTRPIIS